MAALMDQSEQCQQSGPGAVLTGEALSAASGDSFQFFQQSPDPVGGVVEGVVAGQQVAGFGEEITTRRMTTRTAAR